MAGLLQEENYSFILVRNMKLYTHQCTFVQMKSLSHHLFKTKFHRPVSNNRILKYTYTIKIKKQSVKTIKYYFIVKSNFLLNLFKDRFIIFIAAFHIYFQDQFLSVQIPWMKVTLKTIFKKEEDRRDFESLRCCQLFTSSLYRF